MSKRPQRQTSKRPSKKQKTNHNSNNIAVPCNDVPCNDKEVVSIASVNAFSSDFIIKAIIVDVFAEKSNKQNSKFNGLKLMQKRENGLFDTIIIYVYPAEARKKASTLKLGDTVTIDVPKIIGFNGNPPTTCAFFGVIPPQIKRSGSL
eukprot:402668_1